MCTCATHKHRYRIPRSDLGNPNKRLLPSVGPTKAYYFRTLGRPSRESICLFMSDPFRCEINNYIRTDVSDSVEFSVEIIYV